MTESTHGTWESQGLTLHYQQWGRPDLPLAIIHHGFLDLGATWAPVAERLSSSFRVLAVDARGHGESEWIGPGGAYYFPDYVLDLHNLIQSLGVTEPIALIGHSMGGGVTSYYAGAFPDTVRALVLIEGLGPPKQTFESAPGHLKRFVESTRDAREAREPRVMPDLETAAEKLQRQNSAMSLERALEVARLATRRVRGGVIWRWDPLHRARIGTPYVVEHAMAMWRAISAPVLSVAGAASRFWWPGIEERLIVFRQLEQVHIEGAGHNLHLDAPEALSKAIVDYLGAL